MAYNILFIDGSLKVTLPPCTTVANGAVAFFKGKNFTLPDSGDGVIAINFYDGDVQFFQDVVDVTYPFGGNQHPGYLYLEYVSTRDGSLIQHMPLVGPFPASGVVSNEVWGMVSNPITDTFNVGGPTGGGNYYNGHNFNMSGSVTFDVTLSKAVGAGFQVRFLNITASGFRLLTDSSVPIIAKASLTISGIGSTASAIVYASAANGDAKWFVTST